MGPSGSDYGYFSQNCVAALRSIPAPGLHMPATLCRMLGPFGEDTFAHLRVNTHPAATYNARNKKPAWGGGVISADTATVGNGRAVASSRASLSALPTR